MAETSAQSSGLFGGSRRSAPSLVCAAHSLGPVHATAPPLAEIVIGGGDTAVDCVGTAIRGMA